jgi:NADH dehydrogenase [ubiquinone] 1 alpha subcomplex assembly factor 7
MGDAHGAKAVMSLRARIAGEIRRQGPMSVARYMELALLDPQEGYYQTQPAFGVQGDFITAPEISQIFGEMIGAWCADTWQRLGRPAITLMELGPGRGTLMQDLLRATRQAAGFHEAADIRMVEASARLQEIQKEKLADRHPRIHWQFGMEPLPQTPLLLVANEFFDALPVRQFVRRGAGWKERRIALEGERLAWAEAPADVAFGEAPEGAVREQCEQGEAILRLLCAHVKRQGGALLIIDYGYAQGQGDTLQAVRAHAYAPVLEAPGQADITAHVDFGRLRAVAQEGGLSARLFAQGDWLRRMGAELRAAALCRKMDIAGQAAILSGLERLMSPALMGTLFNVLEVESR